MPKGSHRCRLDSVEEITSTKFEGDALRWTFISVDEKTTGRVAVKVTGTEATATNSLGQLLMLLSGEKLDFGAAVDANDFLGREFIIEQGPTGIKSIRPVPATSSN